MVAVGSRSQSAADAFGKEFNIPSSSCYPSLSSLLEDPNVDAVYVGTPHPFHKEAVSAALKKGFFYFSHLFDFFDFFDFV